MSGLESLWWLVLGIATGVVLTLRWQQIREESARATARIERLKAENAAILRALDIEHSRSIAAMDQYLAEVRDAR